MALPISVLPRSSAVVLGETVEFRSLSRTETYHILSSDEWTDAYVIAKATDTSEEEAAKWLDTVKNDVAFDFLREILIFSGVVTAKVDEGSPKAKGSSGSSSGR